MSDHQAKADEPGDDEGVRRDARDLTRNALFNVIAYGPRLAVPVLTALVTRAYGLETWGVYTLGASITWVAMRVALFGLDRAMIWWIPAALEREGALVGVRAALRRVVLAGAATSVVLAVAAPLLARLWDMSDGATTTLLWMCAGLLPLTVAEFLLQACVAKRTLRPVLLIRDFVTPMSLLLVALGLHAAGAGRAGIGAAYFASNALACLGAVVAFSRTFRGHGLPAGPMPAALMRYAKPVAVTDLAYTAMNRIDAMVLGVFASEAVVGVYGIVKLAANTVGSVDRMFGTIVVAIVSDVSRGGAALDRARSRIAESFSHATALVSFVQIPIAAALYVFGPWIFPLFDDSATNAFATASTAVGLACGFWVLAGFMALAGQVVNGLGDSRATMRATLAALALELALLFVLSPAFGLEGAVVSFGIALLAQSAIQLVQMRALTGAWNYTRTMQTTLVGAAVSIALLLGVPVIAAGLAPLPRAILAFGLSGLALGGAAIAVLRRSRHAATPPAPAAS